MRRQTSNLFPREAVRGADGPVECLGQTFETDDARRAHFTELLRQKLRDPAFRATAGFPKGTDEDILRMSDPPYYTACPNPFLGELVRHWSQVGRRQRIRVWLEQKSVRQAFQPAIRYPELRDFSKNDLAIVHQYQRRLPHWELSGSTYFVTFRVSHSVGQAFLPADTKGRELATLLEESLWYFHGERYCLDGYVIMPDHVHLLIRQLGDWTLAKILQGIKGYTARELNRLLGRKGPFWQDESFDHLIRNQDDWKDKLDYIHQNPVKAGLVAQAQDYLFSSLVTLHAEGRLESLPHCTQEDEYRREPFAVDVSVGKTDALYKAHSYHTKVPHLAIVPSILHYTEPGDLVLDGFCGSGMTGVAAQFCGTAPAAYRSELEAAWKKDGRGKPRWGARRAVLNDLGPAATFIAANYNLPFDVEAFAKAAQRILDEVEAELGWMYETLHTDGRTKGRINYTVWSEVFTCPECAGEVVFVKEALDEQTHRVKDEIRCPHCGATSSKERLDLHFEAFYDAAHQRTDRRPKRIPVLIKYGVGNASFEKEPDTSDLDLLDQISRRVMPAEVPTSELPDSGTGKERPGRGRVRKTNTRHVHHMYLPRAGHAVAALWRRALAVKDVRSRNMLLFLVEQAVGTMSVLNRYRANQGSQSNQVLGGVLYIPSQVAEISPWYRFDRKTTSLPRVFRVAPAQAGLTAVSTGDCASIPIPKESVDYIFTDPPFGENIYYADLNFLVEAWHRVLTDAAPEAIVDQAKHKGLHEYQALMRASFQEYARVLKPGRWMTVVFSNSSNAVWRAIQEALGTAGFVVADVRTLDKQQGSYRQVTSSAVKQDLVISAYKPTEALARRFQLGAATVDDAWAFVREHLQNVPVLAERDGDIEVVAERTAQTLHDRMIAFFVQRGVAVPLSGPQFFEGLEGRFVRRDAMYFLTDQVTLYDKKRALGGNVRQLSLFPQDEASAIRWLRQQLEHKPQSFQDLQPQLTKVAPSWARHERTVELKDLLHENFLHYDGQGEVPGPIHAYLSSNHARLRNLAKDDPELRAAGKDRWYVPSVHRQSDLEQLRLRALLREFDEYKTSGQKKIKQFRTEAVRAGFKAAYDARDYRTIVEVAAKLPDAVVQEDEKLLMYVDVAQTRLEDEA